jgi:hypothetical protein
MSNDPEQDPERERRIKEQLAGMMDKKRRQDEQQEE